MYQNLFNIQTTLLEETDIHISQSMIIQIQDFHSTAIQLASASCEILSTQKLGNLQMYTIWRGSFSCSKLVERFVQ